MRKQNPQWIFICYSTIFMMSVFQFVIFMFHVYIILHILLFFCIHSVAMVLLLLLLLFRLLVSYFLLLLERKPVQSNTTIQNTISRLHTMYKTFKVFSLTHLTWQLDALLLMLPIEQTSENGIKGG